jgi:hypothetical protein
LLDDEIITDKVPTVILSKFIVCSFGKRPFFLKEKKNFPSKKEYFFWGRTFYESDFVFRFQSTPQLF